MPALTTVASRDARPLFALVSQVLVVFTLEFDNEFERRLIGAGYRGALSLVVWTNLARFLADGAIPVRELAGRALVPEQQVKSMLGCLERWGFVRLEADSASGKPTAKLHARSGVTARDGWGSARGIRAGWEVYLTAKGRKAVEIWPPLFGEIEARWGQRFGTEDLVRMRRALDAIVAKVGLELPHGLPGGWEIPRDYAPRGESSGAALPLPVLLSQVLLAFTLEFDRESFTPLQLCAGTLRVLSQEPVKVSDIPCLTGSSPETGGIGWQHKPYVVVKADPSGARGKVVRLSARGLAAQERYRELVSHIEKRWARLCGEETIAELRDALLDLFVARRGDLLLMAEGLVPAEGTLRSGAQAPALGRRDVGTAARQRMRDAVAQSERFKENPAGALPYYPLWDMNRGFGP